MHTRTRTSSYMYITRPQTAATKRDIPRDTKLRTPRLTPAHQHEPVQHASTQHRETGKPSAVLPRPSPRAPMTPLPPNRQTVQNKTTLLLQYNPTLAYPATYLLEHTRHAANCMCMYRKRLKYSSFVRCVCRYDPQFPVQYGQTQDLTRCRCWVVD